MGVKPDSFLVKARDELKGAKLDPFDCDFLSLDSSEHVAVFLGDATSPRPSNDPARGTGDILERFIEIVTRDRAILSRERGYRAPALPIIEAIFDPPMAGPKAPLHELPFQGYPHLVVASAEGARVVRRLLVELGGREVRARDSFAAVLDVIGFISNTELHREGACAGCRAVDHYADPTPRAPEALASMGLYVYGVGRREVRGGTDWFRIASPSPPRDAAELRTLLGRPIALGPTYEGSFEYSASLAARWFEGSPL